MSAVARLLIALLLLLQGWAMWRAPAAWYPAAIDIRLEPGQTMTLGHRNLAAPRADNTQFTVRRSANGGWELRNRSAARPTILFGADGERRLGSATLDGSTAFQVGGTRFEITDAKPSAAGGDLTFRQSPDLWRYDGATLYRNGAAQPDCADAGLANRLAARWNRFMPRPVTLAQPLAFGGNVHCGNRLGLPELPPHGALLTRIAGQWRLTPGGVEEGYVPLAEVRTVSAGGAWFALQGKGGGNGSVLTLFPAGHVALFSTSDTPFLVDASTVHAAEPHLTPGQPPAIAAPLQPAWRWQQRALAYDASGGAWLAVCAVLAVATLMLPLLEQPQRAPPLVPADSPQWRGLALTLIGPALAVTGLAAMLAQRSGHAPAAAASLLLAAAALYLWLAAAPRVSLALAAGMVLLAAGLLAQLELGLGGATLSWLRYYQKTAALLAIASGAATCWRGAQATAAAIPLAARITARLESAMARHTEALLAALTLTALAGLAAQVLWGNETGVFDLQPVELAKLALAALSAHCLALRMGWTQPHQGLGMRWLQLAAPSLLFLGLLGLALVQVDDYSPLVLLLLWCCAMTLAYAAAARSTWPAVMIGVLALAAIGSVAGLRAAGPEWLATLPGNFYGDRFQVWLAPEGHAHTGQQWLEGARAIAAGGWLGTDGALGLLTLGQASGSAGAIPAVQDDFAPALFLNRHGLAGALMLWGAQAALLAGLLHQAVGELTHAQAARGFRQAWAGRFRFFLLCGGAAFTGGHLLLSWGTNLAIFPVMGQPMSFLSAGGSHLLFFLCPLLTICMDSPTDPAGSPNKA